MYIIYVASSGKKFRIIKLIRPLIEFVFATIITTGVWNSIIFPIVGYVIYIQEMAAAVAIALFVRALVNRLLTFKNK